jgi:hypothetical protein
MSWTRRLTEETSYNMTEKKVKNWCDICRREVNRQSVGQWEEHCRGHRHQKNSLWAKH